jgi:hypothetical protein
MLTATNKKDLDLIIVSSSQHKNTWIVDAFLGDLFLGRRYFHDTNAGGARLRAIKMIEQVGSLN